jgi:hypothetical protein
MKTFRLARITIAAAGMALAACATAPGPASTWSMPGADAREVSELLERYERLIGQPVDEQKKEVASAQAAFERSPGELSRLRLALALCLPQASWRDDARVVSLLAEGANEPNPSLRRQMAQLLYRLTVERQRLLKEEQRRLEGLQQSDQKRTEAALQTALHDEKKKVEELQQKLDALREIDRNTIKPARR